MIAKSVSYSAFAKFYPQASIDYIKETLDAKFEELGAQYGMSKEDVEKALGNNIEQFARNLRNSLFNEFILKNNA